MRTLCICMVDYDYDYDYYVILMATVSSVCLCVCVFFTRHDRFNSSEVRFSENTRTMNETNPSFVCSEMIVNIACLFLYVYNVPSRYPHHSRTFLY